MAEVEITQEEVRGIDINQVASMQLKDGTVVVVNSEDDQYNNNAEFTQEEVPENENENINYTVESSNLRARPYVVMPGVLPKPMIHKPVVHLRPPPPPPVYGHRGPVRTLHPGYGMYFRARPPREMVQKPLDNQMKQGFKASPQLQNEEFQEEEFREDQYYESDEQRIEEESNQLRARPIGYNPYYPKPVGKVVLPPPHPHPKLVKILPPKRGPVQYIPAPYTHQPRAFRARRPAPPLGFVPVTTYQPRVVVQPPHLFKPPMHHPGRFILTPIGKRFRSRPRSSSYEIERNQNNEEFDDKCNDTCVCSKFGKEFK